jgi:transcription termination factor Rho
MAMVSCSSDYNYHHQMIFIYQRPRLFGLKTGDTVRVWCVLPRRRKIFSVSESFKINGHDPGCDRVSFEHLTPVFPSEKFN